jgi:hypothetical protein
MEQCHATLFHPGRTRREKQAALSRWLAASQPCLFGQMEAKQERLAFCLLTENDLERSDNKIRARIEQDRSNWKCRARTGTLSKNPSLAPTGVPREKLVYWALPKAMKTIGPPRADNRRGTWLVERGKISEDKEPPTFEQRRQYFGDLAAFSENRYAGLYHTDHTIPSDYFNEGLWRREDLKEQDDLYFTYLHQPADDDYVTMGLGEEIETTGGSAQ